MWKAIKSDPPPDPDAVVQFFMFRQSLAPKRFDHYHPRIAKALSKIEAQLITPATTPTSTATPATTTSTSTSTPPTVQAQELTPATKSPNLLSLVFDPRHGRIRPQVAATTHLIGRLW